MVHIRITLHCTTTAEELRSKLRLTENPNMASPTELMSLRQMSLQHFRTIRPAEDDNTLVSRLKKLSENYEMKAVKKSGVCRIPETLEHASSADNCFYQSIGKGLEKFIPKHRLHVGKPLCLVPAEASERDTLKVVIDRKSTGFRTFNYLFYNEGLRGFPARDIFHGDWRDFLGSVSASGGMVALCKLILIQNTSKNPWLGGDFRRQKEDL